MTVLKLTLHITRTVCLNASSAQTASLSAFKVYGIKFISTYKILFHPDYSCCQDKINRDAGRRSCGMVFETPLRQFYRNGTNPAHLSGLSHLDNFIMTRKLSSAYRDRQKRIPTPTRTVTQLNRRAFGIN
jgi:hypothetical protein